MAFSLSSPLPCRNLVALPDELCESLPTQTSQLYTRPPRSKGRNFSADEECQLCKSYLHVSQDPRIGSGQKNATFWARITSHFNNVAPSGKRPERSLESKWSSIKHDVSKFVGVYAQVEDLLRSGTSDADVLVDALELYKVKNAKGTSFTYLHCWYLLKNVPRWGEGSISESRRSPSIPLVVNSPSHQMSGGSEMESDSASPQGRSPQIPVPKVRTRPQGTRAAKEDQKSLKTRDGALRAQAAATKEMADATKRKADLLEDQNLILLMTADEAGIVSEDAREWVLLKRRLELRKLRRKLAEEEDFDAHIHVSAGGRDLPPQSRSEAMNQDPESGDRYGAPQVPQTVSEVEQMHLFRHKQGRHTIDIESVKYATSRNQDPASQVAEVEQLHHRNQQGRHTILPTGTGEGNGSPEWFATPNQWRGLQLNLNNSNSENVCVQLDTESEDHTWCQSQSQEVWIDREEEESQYDLNLSRVFF